MVMLRLFRWWEIVVLLLIIAGIIPSARAENRIDRRCCQYLGLSNRFRLRNRGAPGALRRRRRETSSCSVTYRC